MEMFSVNMGLAWQNWRLISGRLMNEKEIVYKINQSQKNDIHAHLIDCVNLFIPPLNLKTDIENYAEKIYEKADKFEAWNDDRLIGLIAIYCNNFEDREAYITNVSVVEAFSDMGIASKLLSTCIKHVEGINFKRIALKVNKNNKKARSLYKKFGFVEVGSEDENIIMRCKVKNE